MLHGHASEAVVQRFALVEQRLIACFDTMRVCEGVLVAMCLCVFVCLLDVRIQLYNTRPLH